MTQKNEIKNDISSEDKKNKPVSFLFFLIFWAVIISLGSIFFGKELGVGLIVAAFISGILWQSTVNSQYCGVIESFETKTYRDNNDIKREEKKAIVRLDNGRKKKIYYDPRWKVGDRIVKKKGEVAPSVENSKN